MTISYIIPVWNRPDFLEFMLVWLKRQTHIPEQIIIIDDDSDTEYAVQHERLCQLYGVEYHYNKHDEKKLRLHESFNYGLSFAREDVICFGSVDIVSHDDYCEQCCNLVSQYSNMILSHIVYYLTKLQDIKEPFFNHEDLYKYVVFKKNGHMIASGYNILVESYDFIGTNRLFMTPKYLYHPSLSHNPQPILSYVTCVDGNLWCLTENAKNIQWDNNIIGWGHGAVEFCFSALVKGMSIVFIGDIISYHIEHEHQSQIYNQEDRANTFKYLTETKWTPDAVKTIPISNPLKKKASNILSDYLTRNLIKNHEEQQDNPTFWNNEDILLYDTAKATVEQAKENPLAGLENSDIGELKTIEKIKGILDRYNISEGSKIVEVGCGGGRICMIFNNMARHYKMNIELIGIDHAPGAISVCRARIPHRGFHVLQASDIGEIADPLIDMIYTNTALQHNSWWKQDEIFQSIYRSLKYGGILYLINEMTFNSIDNIPQNKAFSPFFYDDRGSAGTAAWWIARIASFGFELMEYNRSEYIFRRI